MLKKMSVHLYFMDGSRVGSQTDTYQQNTLIVVILIKVR